MSQHQIRMAIDADREVLRTIWDYCFHDGDTFQRWYFENYYCKDECIVGCVEDTPVASLQMIDLPMQAKGETIRAAYIVGVDCLPEYRGLGFTRQLMEEALLHYAPEHHLQLIHLMPFEADFYEPYGFVFSDFHFKMDIDIAEFYRAADRDIAHCFHWQDGNTDALEAMCPLLEQLYERCMTQYDAWVERKGIRRWRALIDDLAMEDGYLKLLFNAQNEAIGLLAYIMKEDVLYVREALALDGQARQAVYYFIASHRSQVKRVQWSAPENEPVAFRRKKDKDGVRYYPFMMNLIVDPMILPLFTDAVPKNDLCFSVAGRGCFCWPAGKSGLKHVAEDDAAPELTYAQLTQLVFDRSWRPPENDEVLCALAMLFTRKPIIFNNEYF